MTPSRRWYAISGALIALSVILALFGLVRFVQSFDVDAEFRADGQPHVVSSRPNSERMLFLLEGQDVPRCTVDGAPARPVTVGDYTWSTGGRTWVGFAVFDSPGQVEVVCRAERADVRVAASMSVTNVLRGVLFFMVLPGALFMGGLIGIIVTALHRSNRSRPMAT